MSAGSREHPSWPMSHCMSVRDRVHSAFVMAIAAVVGIRAGWLDVYGEGFGIALLTVSVACFFIGAIRPRDALKAALVVGLCVPLVHVAARIVGVDTPVLAPFFALIPAFVGALAGTGVRQTVARRAGLA